MSYAADAVSRLGSLGDDLPGSAYDRTVSFAYNPASQLASVTRSNDGYAYNGHYNHADTTTINALNQATAAGGTSIAYDARGNVTAIGADGYGYSLENLLTSGPRGTTLAYDPIGRLSQLSQSGTTRFGYDGADLTAEYDAAGTLQRRYVYAPGGEPLVWYEGAGTSDRRWLHADERGSIVAVSDGAGRVLGTNGYDEYGQPAPTNIGRIGYTGQAWLPELNLWYYKARMYAPGLGRFLQTDPIGYGDGTNWYGYVGGDPVNNVDPDGLQDQAGSAPPIGASCNGAQDPVIRAECQNAALSPPIYVYGCRASACLRDPDEIRAFTASLNALLTPVAALSAEAGAQTPQRDPQCTRVVPLPKMMTDATNSALSAINQNPGGNSARDLNSGFSSLGSLPDFSGGGWVSRPSSHSSQAYEHSLPGSSGMSVKVYINDRENSGLNTVTITPPTYSVLHFAEFPFYEAGAPVNTYNAAKYLGGLHGC